MTYCRLFFHLFITIDQNSADPGGGSRLPCISKTTGRLFFIYRRSTAQHGGESTSVVTGNKTEAVSFIRWPVEFLRKVLFSPLLLFYLTGMRPGAEFEIVKLRSVALKFDFFYKMGILRHNFPWNLTKDVFQTSD